MTPTAEDQRYQDSMLPPDAVTEQLRLHDERMEERRLALAEAKAIFTTSWWKFKRGKEEKTSPKNTEVEIEVNRLWPVLMGYNAALYPRSARPVVGPDPSGNGDPGKAQLTLKKLMSSHRVHSRINTAIQQALLYPAAAAKVGYRHGYGSPIDRTYMRIVPYWELLEDVDCSDLDDARYRGHVYYAPRAQVEKKYKLDLQGTGRQDFLGVNGGRSAMPENAGQRLGNKGEQQAFVRMAEVCNLVDVWEGPRGVATLGRFEVYILGQGKKSERPAFCGPLPFARVDGTPLPHIGSLLFNHEPEFPARGIPHVQRLIPQLRELNAYRSYMATTTRKDVRMYMIRKGYFDDEKMHSLVSGEDGIIFQVDKDDPRPLSDIIHPIENTPISGNILTYMQIVEADFDREVGQSPNARGEVMRTTAFEAKVLQQNTESDYGRHAEIKDQWLAEVGRLLLRAVSAAMGQQGDSTGAYSQEAELELGPSSARPEPQRPGDPAQVDRAQVDAREDAEEAGGPAPMVDDNAEMPEQEGAKHEKEEGEERPEAPKPSPAPVQTQAQSIVVLSDNGEPIEVTAEDLDGDFEISFQEGGLSPTAEADLQAALVRLRKDLEELWAGVQKGDPFAMAYMRVLCEKFNLPRDLHPDALLRALADKKAEKGAKKKPGTDEALAGAMDAPPPGGPPAGAPPAGAPGGPPDQGAGDARQMLAQIAQMPPPQALAALRQLFADNEELLQAIESAESAPPEQQAQFVKDFISGVLGGA